MGVAAKPFGKKYSVKASEDLVLIMKNDIGIDRMYVLSFLISSSAPTRVNMGENGSLCTISSGGSEVVNCPYFAEGIGFAGTDTMIVESDADITVNCFYTEN